MRLFYFILLFNALFTFSLHAQNKLHFGYYINPSLNLYQRIHQPKTFVVDGANRSSGQVLNLLPNLSTGLWFGQAQVWAVGVEGGVEYIPFSFNLQNYEGMGSVSFPVLLRGHFPLAKQHSSAITLDVAGGLQWNKTELYLDKNAPQAAYNPFFVTYTFEVAGGIGAISQKANQIRGVDLYFRFGFGADASMSFHTGLRVHFWNALL